MRDAGCGMRNGARRGPASPVLLPRHPARIPHPAPRILSVYQAISYVLIALMAIIGATNLRELGRRRRAHYRLPGDVPRVSILVPARNEERTIAACVQSLLSQDYPDFEILVLDDASEDRTGALVRQFEKDPRLRTLRGTPLPAGWLGKPWACHQLAQAASGEVLLFTDADTVHHPKMLGDAVAALQAERVDLLSALPRLRLATWSERLVLPILLWSVHTFLPLCLARRFSAWWFGPGGR